MYEKDLPLRCSIVSRLPGHSPLPHWSSVWWWLTNSLDRHRASECDRLNGVQMTWRNHGWDMAVTLRSVVGLAYRKCWRRNSEINTRPVQCTWNLRLSCICTTTSELWSQLQMNWIELIRVTVTSFKSHIRFSSSPPQNTSISISCRIWKWDPLVPPRMAARGEHSLLDGYSMVRFVFLIEMTRCVVDLLRPSLSISQAMFSFCNLWLGLWLCAGW